MKTIASFFALVLLLTGSVKVEAPGQYFDVDDIVPESMKEPQITVLGEYCYSVYSPLDKQVITVCQEIIKEVQYCCGKNCGPYIKVCQGCKLHCGEGHIIR